MSQELKPCPFCGVTPHLNNNACSNDGRIGIACQNDVCEISVSVAKMCPSEMWPDGKSFHYVQEKETELQAIHAWNRRVQSDLAKVQELEGKLKEAIQALQVATVVMTVDHKADFTKSFGMDGIRDLLKKTEHLRTNFKVEDYMRDTLASLSGEVGK